MGHIFLRYRHGEKHHTLALRLAIACSALSPCHGDSSAASIDHVCLLQQTPARRPDDGAGAIDLEEQLMDLTRQIEFNQQSLADFEKEHQNEHQHLIQRQEEIARLMKDNDEALRDYQSVSAQHATGMGEVETLTHKVEEAEQTFRDTDAQRAELRKSQEQEAARMLHMQEQLRLIEAEKANISAALPVLLASNTRLEAELQKAQSLLGAAKTNVSKAERQKVRAEQTRKALMDDNGAQLVMGDKWNKKLDKMFNSLNEAYYAHEAIVKTLDRVRSALAATATTQ